MSIVHPPRTIPYHAAILEATAGLMEENPSVYIMGLGVPDPKGIFGTTLGLQERFGPDRVFDMPTSENGMTGIAIGSAIGGMRPIITHQRVDFFLLALDQLVNNAAKWHYMFGEKMHVPLVIRLIIGRGWGQGPQHSQSLQSIFAHFPGLKVVMPTTPYDAKGLLISSIRDNNPVIFLEHRWLHGIKGEVPKSLYEVPIGKAHKMRTGNDVTIVSLSHMTLEAVKGAEIVEKEEGISVEVIDLRSIRPFDKEMILKSVQKTGRLLVCDPDWKTGGFSTEIITTVVEEALFDLKVPPKRVAYPDRPLASSWSLANHFYPTKETIAIELCQLMRRPSKAQLLLEKLLTLRKEHPLDVPDPTFIGPF